MQQVTFRIPDLKNLIGDKKAGNVLIEISDKEIKASIVSNEKSADGGEVVWIDGCPFPPGCTEGPQP